MDYKVVVMPHGRVTGLSGRLATEPDDSEYQTPCIETVSTRFYPEDVLWVFAKTSAAKKALKEAGYKVRNVLGSVMYIDVI